MSHIVIEGVPYINGKRAIECPPDDVLVELMEGALAPWKCPECGSHLAGESLVCMNLCSLTVPEYQKFQNLIALSQAKVDDRHKREES